MTGPDHALDDTGLCAVCRVHPCQQAAARPVSGGNVAESVAVAAPVRYPDPRERTATLLAWAIGVYEDRARTLGPQRNSAA